MKILSRPALFISLFAVLAALPAQAQISANHNDGSVILGYDSTACTGTIEGALRYSSATKFIERCNGTEWGKLPGLNGAGVTSIPPTGVGYFVLTSGAWDGALGGVSGASAKCLSDLTTNTWMGKATASSNGQLNAAHIESFLCSANRCVNAVAGVTYYFATSGDATKGGASFVADSNGIGPGDAANWSGTTYFGSAVQYWTGRVANTATLWASASQVGGNQCAGWNSNSGAEYAGHGVSNATNGTRFSDATGVGNICAATKKLICFVHP